MDPAMPRLRHAPSSELRHAPSSELLEKPKEGCTSARFFATSARFFATSARFFPLLLRRLFLERDGDRLFLHRDDDRSLFLDTVTAAVFLERSCDGINFLLREIFLLVAATPVASMALMERSRDAINFLLREIALLVAATAVASMDLMAATACLSERSTFCFCCFALATCVFLLCDGLSVP